jgi:hypothetical protein
MSKKVTRTWVEPTSLAWIVSSVGMVVTDECLKLGATAKAMGDTKEEVVSALSDLTFNIEHGGLFIQRDYCDAIAEGAFAVAVGALERIQVAVEAAIDSQEKVIERAASRAAALAAREVAYAGMPWRTPPSGRSFSELVLAGALGGLIGSRL